MTHDEVVHLGDKLAASQIEMYERAFGLKIGTAFAAGIARGACRWVVAKFGARTAFEMMSSIADECLGNELIRTPSSNQ